MNTSTMAVSSPIRRRISTKRNLVDIENDAEIKDCEIRLRRLEAINKAAVPTRRSVAAPLLAGLSREKNEEHMLNCIKMSTENKISTKNAFQLRLIDLMAVMNQKKDSEDKTDFQIASSTLDAGVKIYGCRVDAVYTDTVKMVGGLVAKESVENENDSDNEERRNSKGKAVKKNKKKRKCTIVDSKTLNAKTEQEVLLDVAPKKTLLARNIEGMHLLTCVPKNNDGCLLMVEAEEPCWPDVNQNQLNVSTDGFDPVSLHELFSDISVFPEDKICEIVSAIKFGAILEDDLELNMSQTSAFEFDINTSVRDVDCEESIIAPRLAIPTGGYDSGDDIALPEMTNKRIIAPISDLKRRLSIQDREYTMFDEKLLKSWDGPLHWMPRRRSSNRTSNKENNEEGSRVVGEKRTRRRTKNKEMIELFQIEDNSLNRLLAQSAKSVLAKTTLTSWKEGNVTLTEDYKYNIQNGTNLFHLPLEVVCREMDESVVNTIPDDVMDTFDDHHEPECSFQNEQAEISHNDVEEWDANNMVAIPNKVEKILVGTFSKPKHVDMRQLKMCIWDILCLNEKDTGFSELCQSCPEKLPKKMADTVSVPVMFNALLHLANEKSLKLEQKKDNHLITISK